MVDEISEREACVLSVFAVKGNCSFAITAKKIMEKLEQQEIEISAKELLDTLNGLIAKELLRLSRIDGQIHYYLSFQSR